MMFVILSVSFTAVSAQSKYDIPSWVKGVAGFWAEGKITDNDFGEAISFLIEQKILKVNMPNLVNDSSLNEKIILLEQKNKQLVEENNRLKTENSKLKSDSQPISEEKQSGSQFWKKVVTLTSSTSKKTDTFKITGEKWRFIWSCKAENEYDGVNIAVYKPTSDGPIEFLLMQRCPSTPETTYVYKGAGEYYFDVMSANISGWTITVEEQ